MAETLEQKLRAKLADEGRRYGNVILVEAEVAEIADALAATSWQSIATAPKDGTWLVLTGRHRGRPWATLGRWWPVSNVWGANNDDDDLSGATHWMPLPDGARLGAVAAVPNGDGPRPNLDGPGVRLFLHPLGNEPEHDPAAQDHRRAETGSGVGAGR